MRVNTDKDDSQILAMFKADHDFLPKRLSPEAFSHEYNDAPALHKMERSEMPDSIGMLVDWKNQKRQRQQEEREIEWAWRAYGTYQF